MTEVIVDKFYFIDTTASGGSSASYEEKKSSNAEPNFSSENVNEDPIDDDDFPF